MNADQSEQNPETNPETDGRDHARSSAYDPVGVESLEIKTVAPSTARRRRGWAVPGWLYGVLFVVFDFCCFAMLQWGVSSEAGRVSGASIASMGQMIEKMGSGNYVFLLNLLIIGLAYLAVLMATNRFWVATPIMLCVSLAIAVAEHFKIEVRYEAIQPADLNFLGGNATEIAGFIPDDGAKVIGIAVAIMVAIIALAVLISHFDLRHGSMVRMSGRAKPLGAIVRLLLVVLPITALGMYTHDVGTTDSWAYRVSRGMGDTPSMWDSVYDAQRNGPIPSFLRAVNPKVMDEPAGYSKATMEALADKYASEAASINESRTGTLTDNTVICILSETFSDPENVPGITLNKDPIPNVREIMGDTTSGKMLSSGYGGGTANLEYMQLTGLSMANFDSSLTSPYQQLVPAASWTPTFNQLWGSSTDSVALHPYEASMYSRETNYVKFGFSKFYALSGGTGKISHTDRIDDSPYVSDESAYKSTLEQVESSDSNQFIQLMTMQNHMPYTKWYKDNEYKVTSAEASGLKDSEVSSIETYAKGLSYTDEATADFLEELDRIDKPITVVFYGDHLPGIYKTAGEDSSNSIALHETDYFIWSNKASGNQGRTISDAAYTSPNFFMAQAADQMDAKVSPYLAFLTELHEKVAAMEPPVVNTIQGWDRIPAGSAIYLNQEGEQMSYGSLDDDAKQLLEDYKLIQYDITAGEHYLKDTSFMALPDNAGTM